MNAPRRSAIVTVLLCCTSGLTAANAVPAGATDDSGVPLFIGRLLQDDGSPAAGVSVTASLLDFSGATPDAAAVTTTTVSQAVTDDGGYVELIAPSIDYDDAYQVSAVVDGQEVVDDFSPTPPDSGATNGRSTLGSAPTVAVIKAGKGVLTTRSGAPRRVGADAPKALAQPGFAGDDDDSYELPPDGYQQDPVDDGADTGGTTQPPAGLTEVAPDNGTAPTKCVAGPQWSHISGVHKFRNLPVRGVLTASHSSQAYTYQTSNETRAGGALDAAGETSALSLMHGTGDTWSQTITWPRTKLGNDTTWALFVQWDFEKWQAWCPWTGGRVVKMNVTAWWPWEVAGGSSHKATPMAVACNYRHTVDGKTTLTDAHTESWSGWFSILGVSLDTATTQGTKTAVTIVPDNTLAGNNEKDPSYCSTGSTIHTSAWFREDS
ncbi:MAG TPA: hypothetical protein VHW64_06775 [Nocardioides sp.]|uniref:hypothetical protein n=1 Tax=Nocardioides sp. TaxID=35761 RepID=UPI002E31160E|nr:hypothetical protein [Nocardioides sp.]HEX3930390.1 hypothetical protein [Nocardioides sp.]